MQGHKPEWIKKRIQVNDNWHRIVQNTSKAGLTTVCKEAKCPNIHECWSVHKTATFMILGEICTRHCKFCAVRSGKPLPPDLDEPARLAQSARAMDLKHVVITMVNRDDLEDGGASIMAATVQALRTTIPGVTVEVLSSDLQGKEKSIQIMLSSVPDIMSHNLETVERLTPMVRSKSTYRGSLDFLANCAKTAPGVLLKSSLMLGLGETLDEIAAAMDDLLIAGVSVLNLGQYLQADEKCIPVERFWTPDEFSRLAELARSKGFSHCEAGPLVRSSYHAAEQWKRIGHRIP